MDSVFSESVGFNPAPATVMHIDLNSCFATIEQQANPRLRGQPVAVAAYTSPGGCILASSTEAKGFGVKTGMRVRDGKSLCAKLIVLPSDPWKYRFVNRKLLSLVRRYTTDIDVQSIDELVLNFAHSAALSGDRDKNTKERMKEMAEEIKKRIKSDIGEWLTVSVGIAPNRYLAKVASGLHKPDGLDEITRENIEEVFEKLELEELCGIKKGYGGRLRRFGIESALDFYKAPIKTLLLAFDSIVGHYWWMRIHGWEADDRQFGRKSFGHSYALYTPYRTDDIRLGQILCQLVEKMGLRLRSGGYTAQGIHVYTLFSDYTHWHHGKKLPEPLYANTDLYKAAQTLLAGAPVRPVRIISVSCFALQKDTRQQLTFFEQDNRKRRITLAMDSLAYRWGKLTVTSGRMLAMPVEILDRIAFGGVTDLEDPAFDEEVMYEHEKQMLC